MIGVYPIYTMLTFHKYESHWSSINSHPAKFIFEDMKIYLHFLSFLNMEMAQVFEILARGRRGPTYRA